MGTSARNLIIFLVFGNENMDVYVCYNTYYMYSILSGGGHYEYFIVKEYLINATDN